MTGFDKVKVTIRQTDERDVSLILGFIRAIAEFEHLSDSVMTTEEDLSKSLFGPRPYAEVAVAEVGNKSAGFVMFFHNFSSFAGKPGLYIEDIYVHPEYRGRGVGRSLMVYCARIAKERGCGRMDWSVLNWNPARKFYESLGAQAHEEWIIYRMGEKAFSELAEG
ncbi:GNAT family N-acetyltransferase [Methanolobus halotolerans]|uniref:N-acetyltransferase n=1 Tax=Methanolobus halotolerans TaxID=2052935 RepID=A0A4E0Q832_9EURY|nr:GNAT family N-acetyltransferase [Methanolobus halotolerans]TGC07505.1 N-acetyltransferase [Methanolobus halotolerans]